MTSKHLKKAMPSSYFPGPPLPGGGPGTPVCRQCWGEGPAGGHHLGQEGRPPEWAVPTDHGPSTPSDGRHKYPGEGTGPLGRPGLPCCVLGHLHEHGRALLPSLRPSVPRHGSLCLAQDDASLALFSTATQYPEDSRAGLTKAALSGSRATVPHGWLSKPMSTLPAPPPASLRAG